MSGLNPQGCQRDFIPRRLRGGIWTTIFCGGHALLQHAARSVFSIAPYYEEVLVARVHPRYCRGRNWRQSGLRKILAVAFEDINGYERYLSRNGIRCPEVLPDVSKEGAKKAIPRTAGRAREKLEISTSDGAGTAALE